MAPAGSTEEQEKYDNEEYIYATYERFLAGDRNFLEETQLEKWFIPEYQDNLLKYEYTYLDLDDDALPELLVQLVDDPCGYNAVFHLEEGKIFCWNSDTVEMSCRDYPLSNGMMVRQYDFAGTRTYNLFRYTSEGEMETITTLFVREQLMQEDSLEKCPYYSIDGNEIDEMEFEKQFELLIASNLLESTEWIGL